MCSRIKSGSGLLVALLLCLVIVVSNSVLSNAQVEELHKSCSTISEPAPKYSIEERDYHVSPPRVLLLRITVPTEAMEGESVVRLACKLGSDFPNEDWIEVLIFDDRKAARRLAPGFTDQPHNWTYLWHLRGHYKLHRAEKKELIEYVVPEVEDGLPTLKRVKIWLSRAD